MPPHVVDFSVIYILYWSDDLLIENQIFAYVSIVSLLQRSGDGGTVPAFSELRRACVLVHAIIKRVY